ncbi:MAG TPA: hypothetical protein VL334_22060 [Anaerolineae bacterium]|nr:hypothetical protein [Anaerolineae bacterium]
MRSSDFMAALPEAVQRCLGEDLRLKRGRTWPWGVQFYVDDPRYHYEISRVAPRLGDRLELGLHFESKSPADNQSLLAGFDARLVEIKDSLGDGAIAELWDRGWAKVYETVPLEPYSESYLKTVAGRMATLVRVLHPIFQALTDPVSKT